MPRKDPEARAEYQRQWQEKNREKVRENQRLYQERNREKQREYHRRYYEKNRERLLQEEKERYRSSPEAREAKKERSRRWAEEHPEEMRERQRRHWAKKKYGLTLEELDAIVARGCAICGVKEDPQRGNRRHGRLCIDHDHTNGKIRDALCHGCNTGLGSFGDDPARLRAAADYLEQHTT